MAPHPPLSMRASSSSDSFFLEDGGWCWVWFLVIFWKFRSTILFRDFLFQQQKLKKGKQTKQTKIQTQKKSQKPKNFADQNPRTIWKRHMLIKNKFTILYLYRYASQEQEKTFFWQKFSFVLKITATNSSQEITPAAYSWLVANRGHVPLTLHGNSENGEVSRFFFCTFCDFFWW